MTSSSPLRGAVRTVLGPVDAGSLGTVAVHESLLSVVPGAEHAFDVTIDRAEIFDTLAARLVDFRAHGGGTVVDSSGMFHGRDLRLYEALSRATGVHVVASTGMGPEEMLGGYFLTPQTNPPTPWPAERFAGLFAQEVEEGMVVPRLERRAPAGLVTVVAARQGMTPTEESLFRGAARAALATGVPLSLQFGDDALHDLGIVLDEHLPADRVVVGGLDRADGVAAADPVAVARRGAYVALDHVGSTDPAYLSDGDRASLVLELVEAGLGDRVLLSSSSVGVAKGHEAPDIALSHVLSTFVPQLRERGLDDAAVRRIVVDNPADLLSAR